MLWLLDQQPKYPLLRRQQLVQVEERLVEKGRNPPEFKDPPVEDDAEDLKNLKGDLLAQRQGVRPCIAWYIHVHNLSREGFSGQNKIWASAVVSLPNMGRND